MFNNQFSLKYKSKIYIPNLAPNSPGKELEMFMRGINIFRTCHGFKGISWKDLDLQKACESRK